MLRGLVTAALVLALSAARMSPAEDPQLRAKAVELMAHARLVARPDTRDKNVETTATFHATTSEISQAGTLRRLKGAQGYLREAIDWGNYHASMVGVRMQRATTGSWDQPPYPVRKVLDLVPFSVGSFESTQAIRSIRPNQLPSGPATCVYFETIEADTREPGDVCFDDATGVLLQAHEGGKTFLYSNFLDFAGAHMPGRIQYEERGLTLTVDLSLRVLDTLPEDAFAFPSDAKVGNLCARFSEPVPLLITPPPAGTGANGSTNVLVNATITADGTVSEPRILHSTRADLDAEALKTVAAWRFTPGTCNGKPIPYAWDLTVPFRGR